jgi:hypothetical protein
MFYVNVPKLNGYFTKQKDSQLKGQTTMGLETKQIRVLVWIDGTKCEVAATFDTLEEAEAFVTENNGQPGGHVYGINRRDLDDEDDEDSEDSMYEGDEDCMDDEGDEDYDDYGEDEM